MVSGLVSTPSIAQVVARLALLGLLSSVGGMVFSGCEKSECLREDCRTSAPEDVAGGSSSATPSSAPSTSKCASNTDCPANTGQACVSGTCRLACSSHFECQGLGECTSGLDSDGLAGHFCDLAHPQKPGQFYTHCAAGTECDAAKNFFCVGAGVDDLDAYCTTDCTDDTTCAPGYVCTPLTRPPCQDVCDLKGAPKDRQCIPSDQIGEGKPFQCGSRGVTRNACRPREFCSPCKSDDDCLAVKNQVCAKDESGAKTCTQLCDLKHPSCPW